MFHFHIVLQVSAEALQSSWWFYCKLEEIILQNCNAFLITPKQDVNLHPVNVLPKHTGQHQYHLTPLQIYWEVEDIKYKSRIVTWLQNHLLYIYINISNLQSLFLTKFSIEHWRILKVSSSRTHLCVQCSLSSLMYSPAHQSQS